jgi:hypothetical protein
MRIILIIIEGRWEVVLGLAGLLIASKRFGEESTWNSNGFTWLTDAVWRALG